jgi:hypothetical protein
MESLKPSVESAVWSISEIRESIDGRCLCDHPSLQDKYFIGRAGASPVTRVHRALREGKTARALPGVFRPVKSNSKSVETWSLGLGEVPDTCSAIEGFGPR